MSRLSTGSAVLVLVAACSGAIAPTAGTDGGADGSHPGDGGSAPVDSGPQDSEAESALAADASPGQDGSPGGDAANDAPCGVAACPAAEAFVLATMGVGASSPATICPLGATQSWLAVGTPTAGIPSVVENGGTQNGDTVTVTCSVVPMGAGFDVSLQVTRGGGAGALTITSPAGLGAVTVAGGGQGIAAHWVSGTELPAGQPATETDCTIAFTYEGEPVPDSPPVAAGRIWGHLSCPQALFTGQTVTGPDGGPTTEHCDGEADFLFEQCEQ